MMSVRRVFHYLFLVFALLFAQQAGAAHALEHAYSDLKQHDVKHAVSDVCEKCADYAQLGNALSVGTLDFTPLPLSAVEVASGAVSFRSIPVLSAAARGPPALL